MLITTTRLLETTEQLIMPNLNQNQKMILVNIDQILTDYLMSKYAAMSDKSGSPYYIPE